ncbi:lactate utilization protein B [Flavihumibacter profundi]|jgi:L-lactate dehydrogenase complex protein LldF|uniref:lactate utilization protein B n=1 Tax=Flavihumibacter profundi TaxID=2716883 RepID=UPI001CC34D1B|nr:lactate utilization protein B [Flavihumibacter profundi]MBZ5858770.1 lactate utilization protein [Flavihumibacter profundi]
MSKSHAALAAEFTADENRTDWHDETLWWVRQKRDKAVQQIPEWEILRQWASAIKEHTLSKLDEYLAIFEREAISNGIKVHWANDATAHNEIILKIIKEHSISKIVKSKSMLTEECHLNEYLHQSGIEVIDTDLGERIVQFRGEPPSHIVLPAIHLKKEDVSETFHEHLGTEKGNNDPQYLTESARTHLREKFIQSELAITGVNFAIAETGGFVVCTNEGNADMGAHAAKIHIACMGIEKIIPKAEHLGVFTRMLARSATGQAITTYTSHFHRPRPGQEMHIVIVNNGRSRQLGREDFRNSLKCIRCAACFNTCPVYRRSGGHSYHTAVAGPIGSILNPNLDMKANADLPFASTLCGSCTNVCPVKINIHEQLWKWRQVIAEEGLVAPSKKMSMQVLGYILSKPSLYRLIGKTGRWVLRHMPLLVKFKSLNPWYKQREMPEAPSESFRDWYKKNRRS